MKTEHIIYFLTRSLFLGFGISILFHQSGKDAYLGAILGLFIGIIITYFYNKIISLKEGQDLDELYKKDKIVGIITRILMGIITYIILIYALVLYVSYVVSFLLVTTPEYYVIIPFIILALYGACKGLKMISRISSFFIGISLVLVIFSVLGLSVFFETTNFLPILTNTPTSFFKSALTFAGISTLPNILTLHFKDSDYKKNLKIYVIAGVTVILAMICINGTLGESLVKIFRFPEYMVLKQLKIFKFIEKVENIFSLVWVVDLYVTTTMAIYSLKKTLPIKYNKGLLIGLLLITIYIVDAWLGFNYQNELSMYYILPYLASGLAIGIIIPFGYLVKKKKEK